MGEEVGTSANALIRRLQLEQSDVEVVLGGSIFKGKGRLLVDTVTARVKEVAPGARIVPLKREPVFGTLLLALEAAGMPATPDLLQRLSDTFPAQWSAR